jgi:hypothetical protein
MVAAAPNPIEIVSGWRYEDFGFHKINNKYWAATDLYTGTRICKSTTRKGCLALIESNKNLIDRRRNEPLYTQRVIEFKELIKEELEKLNENS